MIRKMPNSGAISQPSQGQLTGGAEGKPSEAVRLLFAGEKTRPDHLLRAPDRRGVPKSVVEVLP
jgi:hypothetical protein